MNKRITVIIAIVFVAALSRFLPHAPNFTPLGAMALFGGAYISNRWGAILLPLLAMLVSDAIMGFNGWGFTEQVFVVYGCFALIAALGTTLQSNKGVIRVAGASIGASVVFFALTNFAVWFGGFFHQPALYPLNAQGLLECFAAGLPFFQNTLASDLFYSGVLFGGFYLASINIPVLQKAK